MQRLGSARKARLSIPKVNQRPRVNVANRIRPYRSSLAQRVAAPPAPRPAVAYAGPTTQSQPVDPFRSAVGGQNGQGPGGGQGGGGGHPGPSSPTPSAPATPQPAGLFPIPAYTPAPGQEDPRDAAYWANLAKLRFSDEQEYAKELQEQTRADTDYADAVQTAIRNRGVEQRTLGENAIRSNLGNSGWLDRNEAEQTTAYTQERAHAALTKEQEDQARAAARKALLSGYGIDAAALFAEAGDRYGARKREEAQNSPGETAGTESTATSNSSKGGGKNNKGGGGHKGPKGSGGTTAPPPKHNAAQTALGNRQPAKRKGRK
jgi:hypothetical protein